MEYIVLKSDNAYHIPNFRCRGRPCKTNLPSNTAFRGYGFPEAAVVAEAYVTAVASRCDLSPEEVTSQNPLTEQHWFKYVWRTCIWHYISFSVDSEK